MSLPVPLIFSNSPVRQYGVGVETGLYLFTKDADIKKHIAYAAAKTGDIPAAMRLVTDLALNLKLKSSNCLKRGTAMKLQKSSESSPQIRAKLAAETATVN